MKENSKISERSITERFFLHGKDFFVILNDTACLVKSNPSFQVFTGLTSCAKSPFQDLVHPDDFLKFDAVLQQIQHNNQEHIFSELRLKSSDGKFSLRYWRFFFSPDRNEIYCIGDYKGESEPHDSLLEKVLHHSESGIMVLESVRNADGKIIDFEWKLSNNMACKIVGRSSSELIGSRLLSLMPGNSEDGLFDKYISVTETGEPLSHTFYYGHEGVDKWFDSKVIKFDDGFLVTFTDVSPAVIQRRQLETFFEKSSDMLAIFTENGYFVKVNQGFENVLGYSREEFKGKHLFSFVHPAQVEVTRQIARRILQGKPVENFEIKCISKSGETKWVEWKSSAVNHDIHLIFAVGRDITEQKAKDLRIRELLEAEQTLNKKLEQQNVSLKQQEKQLRDTIEELLSTKQNLDSILKRSEADRIHYSTILNTVLEGIITTDANGIIRTSNKAAARTFGYSENEMIGKTIDSLIMSPFGQEQMYTHGQSSNQNSLILPGKHKQGNFFPIEIAINKTVYTTKAIFVAVFRDITEKQRANEELVKTKNQIESIFRTLDNIFWAMDHKKKKLLTISEAFERYFQIPRHEILKHPEIWRKIILPKYHSVVRHKVLRAVRTGEATCQVQAFSRQDIIWLQLDLKSVSDTSGEVIRLEGLVTDITTQKETEIKLRESEARFRRLADNTPMMIWMSESDGSTSYYNKTWLSFRGRDFEEEKMMGHVADIHPQDKDTYLGTLSYAYQQESKFETEYRLLNKDGDYRWVFDIGVPRYASDGSFVGFMGSSLDITERKRALQELENTKLMMQNILLSIPDAIIFVDTNRVIQWINPAMKEVFAYRSESELIGRSAEILYPNLTGYHELGRRFYNPNRPLLKTTYRVDYKRMNGEVFPSETISTSVKGSNGELLGFLGVIRDITEQRLMEEEKLKITKSLEQFKNTLDATKDSVFMFETKSFRFIYANKGAVSSLEYSARQFANMCLWDLDNESDSTALKKVFEEVRDSHAKQHIFESHYKTKSGKVFPVEVLLQLVSLNDNSKRFIAVVRDISERKASERQLKENELKFRSTFEQTAVGVALIKPDLSRADFNIEFGRILGFKNREPKLAELFEMAQDNTQSLRNILLPSEGTFAHRRFEQSYLDYKGNEVWLNLTASAVYNEGGQIAFFVLFAEDITDKKSAVESLNKTLEALKMRNFELDQFVYKASHDLRAPITSVKGLVNLLRMESSEQKYEELANLMESSLQRLDLYISEIQQYSKSNNIEEVYEEIDFRMLIGECLHDLSYLKNEKRINKEINLNGKKPFYSDSLRLKIIFKNLIANAVQYINNSRKDNLVRISINITESHGIIRIEDNGQGIPKEYQDKVFKMFYRANEESAGAGLGLYIVRQAVAKLNGEISMDSEVGEGTLFKIKLPNRMSY